MGRCCRVLQLDKVYACAAKVGTGGQLTPMEQQMIKPRDPAALKRWKGHDYHVRAGGAGSIAPDRPPVLRLAVPAPAPASHTPSHTTWGGGRRHIVVVAVVVVVVVRRESSCPSGSPSLKRAPRSSRRCGGRCVLLGRLC
eukprot:COSAG01_NODE_12787_length_1685_cov_7.483607_2_plen_140_part_00